MVKQTKPKVPLREDAKIKDFLDMIAPGIIKFQTDHFICGNTFRCVWALREYPTVTESLKTIKTKAKRGEYSLSTAL